MHPVHDRGTRLGAARGDGVHVHGVPVTGQARKKFLIVFGEAALYARHLIMRSGV